MKAYLVTVEVTTRVVVPDDATHDEIAYSAHQRLVSNLGDDGISSHMPEIKPDLEMPYEESENYG